MINRKSAVSASFHKQHPSYPEKLVIRTEYLVVVLKLSRRGRGWQVRRAARERHAMPERGQQPTPLRNRRRLSHVRPRDWPGLQAINAGEDKTLSALQNRGTPPVLGTLPRAAVYPDSE